VPSGVNEVRIPIEAILYGDSEKAKKIDQIIAQGMALSLRTALKLSLKFPMEGMDVTESGGMFHFTKKSTAEDDDDREKRIHQQIVLHVDGGERRRVHHRHGDRQGLLHHDKNAGKRAARVFKIRPLALCKRQPEI
jgi:hypothetical protein